MLFTLLIQSISAAPLNIGPGTYPVCILGAGPSGITVASELQNKHIPYIIFEKSNELGGKAINYKGNYACLINPRSCQRCCAFYGTCLE
jgi:NADPH-dependent glutamate synthase beta subunit-like oxidoreductase